MNIAELVEGTKQQALRQSILSDEFLTFVRHNTAPFQSMTAYYRCAMMEVETKFKVLNEEFSLQYDRNPIEGIKGRIKSNESLIRKLRQRNFPLSISSIEENIWDMAGVRVICSFPDDIYTLAECLLQQDDVTLIQREDYIKNPKPSGYRSLHLVVEVPIFLKEEKKNVKVEVQLRTIAMDCWASLEHKIRYKKDIPAALSEELTHELLECAEMSSELDKRMQSIRDKIPTSDADDFAQDLFESMLLQKKYKQR